MNTNAPRIRGKVKPRARVKFPSRRDRTTFKQAAGQNPRHINDAIDEALAEFMGLGDIQEGPCEEEDQS